MSVTGEQYTTFFAGSYMAHMELEDPISIGNEPQFCDEGNRLALVFLNESRYAVRMVYTESATNAKARVDTALSALHWHVANCPDCNEDCGITILLD